MKYRPLTKKVAFIRIEGPDRKGIIATITGFVSKNNCNIEDIDQRIWDGYLVMTMKIDMTQSLLPPAALAQDLKKAAKGVGCGASLYLEESKKKKNVVILVTKESHCLQALFKELKSKKSKGEIRAIIGNQPDLKALAHEWGVPFHYVSSTHKKKHEEKVLKLLSSYEADLIVLARYMQILSPEFVFRHEGKIINIHPSLLPAFPGPRSYHQAHNKGVEIVGVTAHFATTDLDEGPIITQESFRIRRGVDRVEDILRKGRTLEARALNRAVKLFLDDRLMLRRGKVVDRRFYSEVTEE